MKSMGVGIIGCGMISGNHFHALSKLDIAHVAAVCDIDSEKLKAAVLQYGVPGYADYRELLRDARVESVHICTPHYLHAEMTIAALQAGKHVLCEKPMGMSLSEAEAMKAAAEKSGKQLTVCFQNRYNGASRRLKQIIDGGSLGAFQGGSAFVAWNRGGNYYESSPWRGRWEREGGSVLINQAIHTLDLLKYLVGPLRVQSSTLSAKRLASVIETEDTCDMLLTGPEGSRILFYASNCGVSNLPVQMHLTFEKGELHMNGGVLTIRDAEGVRTENYTEETAIGKDYWGSGHGPLIADFYEHLQSGRAPAILPADAMETMELLTAAYESDSVIRRRKPCRE
ncbi:MAG: Gfo/Idh/MocA family oxidoreductase [Clostridia bacterium]|nr:Gfo/Idh/MocA family oxidoreductase [Clostridia bacterium]